MTVQLYDAIETRFDAILVLGRSVGTDGAVKSIPAGDFRKVLKGGTILDPEYPQGARDRTVEYEWPEIGDGEDGATQPSNPRDPRAYRTVIVLVRVGWINGANLAKFVLAIGSEVKLTCATRAQKRAGEESDRMALALSEPDLFQDPTSEPRLVDCFRRGRTIIREGGPGFIVSESRYVVTIDRNQQTPMRP